LLNQIPQLRAEARALRQGQKYGEYSPSAVGQVLAKRGLIINRSALALNENPLQIADALFNRGRFLVLAGGEGWHAYTVLPAQQDPYKDTRHQDFMVELDSLGGTVRRLGPEAFLQLTLAQPYDERLIFETSPKPAKT
jgi:hypothetical protein